MTKPKQPLQAVRRGIRAMSGASPMRGLRSISPGTRKSDALMNESSHMVGSSKRHSKSSSSNQNHKPEIRDEVIGRISPEKMRKEKQQHQRRGYDARDDNVGASRGRSGSERERSSSNHRDRREQPSPKQERQKGGWDAKLEMPRGTVVDHLAEFSLGTLPPPPPPVRGNSSPRRGSSSKGITITTGSSKKDNRKKQQHSSSPGRRQQHQHQFESQKGKHPTPPRSPQHREQQPSSIANTNTGSRSSTFSRSQLIENPQFASPVSMFSPPPPPPPKVSSSRNSSRASSPKASSPRSRRQRDEHHHQHSPMLAADDNWRVMGRDHQWGATLNSSQSMDSFTAAQEEWVASFEDGDNDLWKFDNRAKKSSSKRSSPRRNESFLSDSTDSRDQDVLDSRQEKYASSTFSNSTVPPVTSGIPPALTSLGRDPREDRDKQQRGKGILNFFGGGDDEYDDKHISGKNGRKGKTILADEMLEIGSEATLTAGDLLVDESIMESAALGSDSSVIFANQFSSHFRATSSPSSPRKHKQKHEQSKTAVITSYHAKKIDVSASGDYLQSKFLQLNATHTASRETSRHQETDDGLSIVSNLTDPSVFKNGTQERERRETPRSSEAPHTPSKQRTPIQSMVVPEPSWEASGFVSPNVTGALGRALDMQFTPQTTTTAPDMILSPSNRPPLLPKSTIDSSSALATPIPDHQARAASPLPTTRRQKIRSRTPSPSAGHVQQGRAPSPATQRTKSRTPSPARDPQPMPPARQISPFRKRIEANKHNVIPKLKPTKNATDDLIEKRLSRSNAQSRSKTTSASKGLPYRQQGRAVSSSPARKKAYETIDDTPKPKTNSLLARAQSEGRAQLAHRQESPFQRDLSRLDRVRGKGTPNTKLSTIGRAASPGNSSQKMEPLSQVMSRVPSSLGSRGGTRASDSIEPRRKESVRSSFSSAKKNSLGAGSKEQKGRASAPRLRQPSPVKNAPVEVPRHKQSFPTKNSLKSAGSSNKKKTETQGTKFPSQFSKRRSASREQHKAQIAAKKTYVPTNAYSGRFTPKKKKNDKLTEIRTTREQERESTPSYSTRSHPSSPTRNSLRPPTVTSPRSPTARKMPRQEGAQKLRNMIKLKNHFDGCTSSGGYAQGTMSSVRKSRPSTKSTWSSGRMSTTTKSSIRSANSSLTDHSVIPSFRSSRTKDRRHDRMSMIRDHGLIDSFSVGGGSDLRSLRTALQSRTYNDQVVLSHAGDFDFFDRYDETKIEDPMQRAGLRLLSAAVVPIQAVARRFLARREALTLLWAALVIQARVRGFLQHREYEYKKYAITTVQSAARGMLSRDRLLFEDYCATEIQRHVRGHLAAVRVYEAIYKISLVQSQVRMKLAIRKATIRMYCALKLQGVARGFLVRCRLKYAHSRATDIQRFVRGYFASMRVFNEIYKITLVQGLVRRKQALDKATMRMALILSLQAVARGYLVRCRLDLAHYHATTIQRYTRGYFGTMRVYEEIYKIMLIQNFVRMKLAVSLATKRMTLIIRVQANWRRYCVLRRMDYAHYNANVIQRYVRGYLATMTVYGEIYKITLVQNFVRMKQAQALANCKRRMVIQVQALVRGFILRGRLEKIRSKAITIQSAWRTFYYRLVYQFKLLDIIILQSVWRRKQACVIANRKRYALENNAATVIQARWRCYDANETYLQYKIEDKAATIIQTKWRCYDTSMDYLHFLADVLIVQSMIRRWFAMREVTAILINKSIVLQRVARGHLGRREAQKVRCAIKIQKTWRGFVAFADYMFRIADIVVVQTVARRWFACRRANYFRHKIEHDAATVLQRWRRRILYRREEAATKIQKVWRGLVQEADFTITLYEFRAARIIQTYWRRFWKFSNYLICLDCSIRIQAVVRGFLARCRYADEQWGAVILQAAARGIVGRRRTMSRKMLKAQTLTSNAIGSLESMAATVIQSVLRGYLSRGAHLRYQAARMIQACYRGWVDRVLCNRHVAARMIQATWRTIKAQQLYVKSVSAIKIQKHWRRIIYFAAYNRFLAARKIQNSWRILLAKDTVLCLKAKKVAAIVIQSAWRGYLYYTNYLFSLCDIVKAQGIVRRHQSKKKLEDLRVRRKNAAATAIQKSWRGFYGYTCFLITLSEIIRIQSFARKYLERKRYQAYHVTMIQKTWRGHVESSRYAGIKTDTIKIQCQMRRVLAKLEIDRQKNEIYHASAVLIQKTWKCYFCRSNYTFIVADVVKVQTEVRRFLAQKLFYEMWERHAIRSAVKIQARWRCYFACSNYAFVRDDAIKLQAIARGFLARNTFLELFGEKCRVSACQIQKVCRGYRDRMRYREVLSKICLIQQRVRYFFIMKELREEATVMIQKRFRGCSCRTSYKNTYADVLMVQATCRRYLAVCQYRILCFERDSCAALRIQSRFRSRTKRTVFLRKRSAILDIQRYWRGFNDRVGLFVAWKQHIYKIHSAALEIQRMWKGYVQVQRYLYKLGSVIEIQSAARVVLAKALVRKKHEAATKIQGCRRRFLARHVMLSLFSKRNYARSKEHAVFLSKNATAIQRGWRDVVRRRRIAKSLEVIHWFSQIVVAKVKVQRKIAAHRIFRFFLMVRSKLYTPEQLLHRKKVRSVRKIQAWYPVAKRHRQQRRTRAARIILKFFRMVKAEVDLEIERELERRRQRKEQRRKHHKKEDQILETAWEKTSRVGVDQPRRRRAEGEKVIQDTLNEIQSRSRCAMISGSPSNLRQRGAPPMLSLADALEDRSFAQSSIVSGTIHAANSFNKPSPSRVASFSQKDFDEDYTLEEAFLDAEILSAKSRRKTEKRHKSKSSRRKTGGSSVASRASVSSRMSHGSRLSVSSFGTRESRDTRASRSSRDTRASRESNNNFPDSNQRKSNNRGFFKTGRLGADDHDRTPRAGRR